MLAQSNKWLSLVVLRREVMDIATRFAAERSSMRMVSPPAKLIRGPQPAPSQARQDS